MDEEPTHLPMSERLASERNPFLLPEVPRQGVALLCILVVTGLWLSPWLAQFMVEARRNAGFFEPLRTLIAMTTFALRVGLGGVMAAWMIGGGGFWPARAVATLGLGALVTWGSAVAVHSMRTSIGSYYINSLEFWYLAIGLLVPFGLSLVVLGISRNWGWLLSDEEASPRSAYQFALLDLLLLMTGIGVLCALPTWIRPFIDTRSEEWHVGWAWALLVMFWFGLPGVLINGIGFWCGIGSATKIVGGGIATLILTFLPTAILAPSARPRTSAVRDTPDRPAR